MNPSDRPAFARVLIGLSAIKPGQKLTAEAIDIYWNSLDRWSLEEFKQAAAHLAGTCEFMPNPYHFEKLRKAGRLTAGEAWALVLKHVRSGSYRDDIPHQKRIFLADEIERTAEILGGYRLIGQGDEDKVNFLERRFAEHYADICDARDTRTALPQITADARPRVSGPAPMAALLPAVVQR